jgi:hypothetical protein
VGWTLENVFLIGKWRLFEILCVEPTIRLREQLRGKHAVVQMSGSNASTDEVREAFRLECFTARIQLP